MKLHLHLALPFMTNTYLVAPASSGPAILIDPGAFDVNLLGQVENQGYYIKSILVTRPDSFSTAGIRTILKIYEAQVYSAAHQIDEFPCRSLSNGEHLDLHGLKVEVLGAPSYSRDAALYKIGNLLFTGDVLTAGSIGEGGNPYSRNQLGQDLMGRFEKMKNNTLVFPGSGPPSTLGVEKKYNPFLQLPPS